MILNSGAISSRISQGSASFNFPNSDGSFWVKARCPNRGTWFVNGEPFDFPATQNFVWQEFGPAAQILPGLVVLQPSGQFDCQIIAVFQGTDGAKLLTGEITETCGQDPRERGYMCPTQASIESPIEFEQSTFSFYSPVTFEEAEGANVRMEFKWKPEWGDARLFFFTACTSGDSDSWFVGGQRFNVPHSTKFEWHLFGIVSTGCIVLEPREKNCRIKYAYLGLDNPSETVVESLGCPVDENRCPSEFATRTQNGNSLVLEDETLFGTCITPFDQISPAFPCFGELKFEFSNRGSFWAKTQCGGSKEDSWYVEHTTWHVKNSTTPIWQRFGTVDCENVLLSVREPNCRITNIFRGYNEPAGKDCVCPWVNQTMYVIEDSRSIRTVSSEGDRQPMVCLAGLVEATQIASDSVGNVYVADFGAGKIIRIGAGCSSVEVVTNWPQQNVGNPFAIVVANDRQLFVGHGDQGLVAGINLAADGSFQSLFPTPFSPTHHTTMAVDENGVLFVGSRLIEYWDPTKSEPVGTLIGSDVRITAVTDIAIRPGCQGLYFTVSNNQLWHCSNRFDSRTCRVFCAERAEDTVACKGLDVPSGVALDCQCAIYVTSQGNNSILRYDSRGFATVLSTSFPKPGDALIDFRSDIYDSGCCSLP